MNSKIFINLLAKILYVPVVDVRILFGKSVPVEADSDDGLEELNAPTQSLSING